jgi:DNA-directed RNA polymerase subunit RPC12/RpoP
VENVIDNVIVNYRLAPYATVAIPMFLSSTTGFRYRTINCMECGAEFLERNNDMLYRLNDASQPAEIAINGEVTHAICGRCQQSYSIMVSINVALEREGVPMHLQPQSVYIASETVKKLRYLHCMECGKPFLSISDRIRQVVDNRLPFELFSPEKVGSFEALCHASNCGQTWALML